MDGTNGWDASAEAWVASLGEEGDWARRLVLDAPMMARVRASGARRALDVGCGEGRFCRLMAAEGIATTGVDPVAALLGRARARHPEGDYREGVAEALPVPDGAFDLAVSYITLVDVPDLARAVAEVARALAPGGRFLLANLTSFKSAEAAHGGGFAAEPPVVVDGYLGEREVWLEWEGVRVRNWHRPLSTYMRLLLEAGLRLVHFDEPPMRSRDAAAAARYDRAPWFHVMEWQKP